MWPKTTLFPPAGRAVVKTAVTCVLTLGLLSACGSSSKSNPPNFDGGGGTDGQHQGDGSSSSHDSGHNKPHDSGHEDAKSSHEGGMTHDTGTPMPEASMNCPDASVVDGATVQNCTDRCGPLLDPCTGVITQCGGCPNVTNDAGASTPQACDLTTNTCGPVITTCAQAGAQCGTIVNSCGTFLDCPDGNPKGCPMGQQCNVETTQCETCEAVTCLDLGFECGSQWLGCGPEDNVTDCGSCGTGEVCNTAFSICEPNCTPGTAAELCMAAGAQCGNITDGCGGIVDCDTVAGLGCPAGQGCGIQGVDNQCSPAITPPECTTLGRNCGNITSVCSGQSISCGSCTSPDVCNANGVCGAPCQPKTCAEFSDVECGNFDDGCGGKVTCGGCEGGICNEVTNTCCSPKTCAANYANECGTGLSNGCGTTLNCACPGGETCTQNGGDTMMPPSGTTGSCCTPKTYGSNQCGTNLDNGCGGTENVNCPNGGTCVNNGTGAEGSAPPSGTVGSCCTRTDKCPASTSNTCTMVNNSCTGQAYQCDECTGGNICANETCCMGAAACMGNGGVGGECNDTKNANGCGNNRTCNCNGGEVCWCTNHVCVAGTDPAGICEAPLNCGSPAYSGKCGTGLTNDYGGTINCNCPGGMMCSTTTAGSVGTCACDDGIGMAYTCANVPMNGAQCGTFSNGCGGNVTCNCSNPADTCSSGKCCLPATCPVITDAGAAIGIACGQVNNGCTTVNCSCPSGTGNENFTCTGGTCQCIPDTCMGRAGTFSNGCGGSLICGS